MTEFILPGCTFVRPVVQTTRKRVLTYFLTEHYACPLAVLRRLLEGFYRSFPRVAAASREAVLRPEGSLRGIPETKSDGGLNIC